MYYYFIGLVLVIFHAILSNAKEIAITFDDSPRFATGYLKGPERAQKLVEALKEVQISEVAFFSVSSNIDTEGKKRLEIYANAGHILANHTHTHPNFNIIDKDEYIKDFVIAHNTLKNFTHFEKWFRFPYLREGNSLDKRDSMRSKLFDMKYFNAYITINNYDWYMEQQFQDLILKNPKMDLNKFKEYYINTLMAAINYYDNVAVKYLGRSPKHVLLLHETDVRWA